jgi:RNA polymerase sigma-70 factor (ECF subfamily)
MATMNPASDAELAHLLRDGDWLRRFAGTLVPSQDVDDIVQSTWLAALQTNAVARSARHWLCGAAANLAHLLHRRRARAANALRSVDAPGHAPAASELVEALEVQRLVSEALLSLAEPTRTVLLLRYQQGLPPAAIAARVGLQVAAVRQRLHRGREAVRARLQHRFGDDWRACIAVAAFVRPAAVPPKIAAGALPVVGLFAAAALAVCVFAASGRAPRVAGSATHVDVVATDAAITSPVVEAGEGRVGDAPLERELVIAPQEPAPTPNTKPATATVRGRLVRAEDRKPIAGTVLDEASTNAKKDTPTADDGTFAVTYESTASRPFLWFRAEGRCNRWCLPERMTDVDLGDIALAPGAIVQGVVLDEKGVPVPRVYLGVRIDGEVPGPGNVTFNAVTRADGTFAFRERAPLGAVEISVETRGLALDGSAVDVLAAPAKNYFALRVRQLRAVRGVVFGDDGRPRKGVELELTTASTNSPLSIDAASSRDDGSFELFERREAQGPMSLNVSGPTPFDLVGEPIVCTFGTSALRVEVRALIPLRMQVIDGSTGKPLETFGTVGTLRRGRTWHLLGETRPVVHGAGLFTFDGLPAGTAILVFSPNPSLAPMMVEVDESMRSRALVQVELPAMTLRTLQLVDKDGAPVQTSFDIVDPGGMSGWHPYTDHQAGTFNTDSSLASSPFKVSGSTSDAAGHADVLLPANRPGLVLVCKRRSGPTWVSLPTTLPPRSEPVRIALPD